MIPPRTRRRDFVLGALGAAALGASSRLLAQTWPERPITFICAWTGRPWRWRTVPAPPA